MITYRETYRESMFWEGTKHNKERAEHVLGENDFFVINKMKAKWGVVIWDQIRKMDRTYSTKDLKFQGGIQYTLLSEDIYLYNFVFIQYIYIYSICIILG